MTKPLLAINLIHGKTNDAVKANFFQLERNIAKNHIDAKWWANNCLDPHKKKFQVDHDWLWRKFVGEIRNKPAFESVGLFTSSTSIEGAICYRVDAKSFIEPSKGALYVERLAAAPVNRYQLNSPPQYLGVGKALLLWAVVKSYNLGLKGRVTLDSVRELGALSFYERNGFENLLEQSSDHLAFMELPQREAIKWLNTEGLL